ncbi:MAG: rane protein [Paenibacillus sp.]|jgi:membrane protein DedA with SNARE-associated domain|nr:rane protein [Paenibacillus sp.]
MLKDLVHSALLFIESLGVWGILLGLMMEVIPSELVLSYGGYLVSQGRVSLIGAVIFGTLGCVLQQIILYWIGRYGGRPFVEKYGKYLMLKKRYLDIAEGWFNKYGPIMVFAARFVPVVRQAISIPAGLAKMPMVVFLFYTTLGTIPWAILFVYLGRTLGSNWEQIDEMAAPFMKYLIIGAIAVTVLYVLIKLVLRNKGRGNRA